MKPHSPEDKAFIHEFAVLLRAAKKKHTRPHGKLKVKEFAKALGVTPAALHKYLNERSRPGLDVLERAKTEFGLNATYGAMDANLIKRRAKRSRKSDEAQMFLPFAIESLDASDINVGITNRKRNGVVLTLNITFGRRPA
jgi:transcriptional regulator with XRE-family HTH domain